MKKGITLLLITTIVLIFMVLIIIGLAYLFMWLGAPKWIAWIVSFTIVIINGTISKNKLHHKIYE